MRAYKIQITYSEGEDQPIPQIGFGLTIDNQTPKETLNLLGDLVDITRRHLFSIEAMRELYGPLTDDVRSITQDDLVIMELDVKQYLKVRGIES